MVFYKVGFVKLFVGYVNVDWFVEVVKIETKMAFHFKNTNKDIIFGKKDEKPYGDNNICRFCEKKFFSSKVRDHCHLTGKNRRPALTKGDINVTQKQNNFIPLVFHIFRNYDCHLFLNKLVDEEKDNFEVDNIPKRNEDFFSVSSGCINFLDSYRFLSYLRFVS